MRPKKVPRLSKAPAANIPATGAAKVSQGVEEVLVLGRNSVTQRV